MGYIVILVAIIAVLAIIVNKTNNAQHKRDVEMELAKHGKTKESAATAPRSSGKKGHAARTSSASGLISKVAKTGDNEYKVYGSGNNLFCTARIKGELVGWGDDYFIIEKDSTLTTYNIYGDKLGKKKLGSSEYVASITMHYFSIGKEGRDKKTKYDKTCSKI